MYNFSLLHHSAGHHDVLVGGDSDRLDRRGPPEVRLPELAAEPAAVDQHGAVARAAGQLLPHVAVFEHCDGRPGAEEGDEATHRQQDQDERVARHGVRRCKGRKAECRQGEGPADALQRDDGGEGEETQVRVGVQR